MKSLIIALHILVIAYGIVFVGLGDMISFFLYKTPMHINPWLAGFNVLAMIFTLLQDRLFGGCILTKFQAKKEKESSYI